MDQVRQEYDEILQQKLSEQVGSCFYPIKTKKLYKLPPAPLLKIGHYCPAAAGVRLPQLQLDSDQFCRVPGPSLIPRLTARAGTLIQVLGQNPKNDMFNLVFFMFNYKMYVPLIRKSYLKTYELKWDRR